MTDKLRQAAQQILEAATDLTILTPREWQAVHGLKINALRTALAEPARMTPAELADRLKRGEKWQLAEQPAESLDEKLVMGLAVIRELTGTQKTDNIEATIEAVRKAVAPQPAVPPGYKLVPVSLLEDLAPAEPVNDDETGGCVFCGGRPAGKPFGDASSDPSDHRPGCPWVKIRALLSGTAPQPAKPAEQEPVAWRGYTITNGYTLHFHYGEAHRVASKIDPLYTAPQPAKREPLTDEEIMERARGECQDMRWPSSAIYIARAIERAHGIGG